MRTVADRYVPETAARTDWPRLVAQIVNGMVNRVRVLETYSVASFTFTPGTAPDDPGEGETYMDTSDHTLKTWNGTAWKSHW